LNIRENCVIWLAELSPHEKFEEDLLHLPRSLNNTIFNSLQEEEIQGQLLGMKFPETKFR
jgi:hypothetical protein